MGVVFIVCDDDDDDVFALFWFCELEHRVGAFRLRLLNLTVLSDERERCFLVVVAGVGSGGCSSCEVIDESEALSVIRKVFLSSSIPSCGVGALELARMCFHDEWLLQSMWLAALLLHHVSCFLSLPCSGFFFGGDCDSTSRADGTCTVVGPLQPVALSPQGNGRF